MPDEHRCKGCGITEAQCRNGYHCCGRCATNKTMHYAWGTAPRFIEAPDGWDNEPTLWDATNPARPVAVLQRRDLGHAAHYWPHLVTALTTDDIDRAIATNRRKDAAHDRMHSHTRGEL